MRHSLAQLLAASSGRGSPPDSAAWLLSTAEAAAPRGGGEAEPKQQQQHQRGAALEEEEEAAVAAATRAGPPEELAEQELLFPGLELGELLEAAARPDWDLDAELSGCFPAGLGEDDDEEEEEEEKAPPPRVGSGRLQAAPRGGCRPGGRSNNGAPGPAGNRLKAAAAARLNRLKKKQYVLGLESRLQGLAAENRQLRDRNRGLNRRLRDLERETGYLRAVLANQSALGQLLSRLAGPGGLRLGSSLFRDDEIAAAAGGSRPGCPQAGESSDHDYALPRQQEQAAAGAAPGGICLHVERDQVSVEFCSVCARRACTLSFKIFFFRCLPCQAPLCRG